MDITVSSDQFYTEKGKGKDKKRITNPRTLKAKSIDFKRISGGVKITVKIDDDKTQGNLVFIANCLDIIDEPRQKD